MMTMKFDIKTVALAKIRCDDYIYFNSREENRMKETLPLLHNIGLQYALKNVIAPSIRIHSFVPTYLEDFQKAKSPIYVYPALPIRDDAPEKSEGHQRVVKQSAATTIFKIGWQDDDYRTFNKPTSKNLLQFSDIKVIDPETTFATFVTSSLPFGTLISGIPQVIRLGKLASKATVTLIEVPFSLKNSSGYCDWLLNPVDLPRGLKIGQDYIASITRMNPNDLIYSVRFKTSIQMINLSDQKLMLPLSYHFQGVAAT